MRRHRWRPQYGWNLEGRLPHLTPMGVKDLRMRVGSSRGSLMASRRSLSSRNWRSLRSRYSLIGLFARLGGAGRVRCRCVCLSWARFFVLWWVSGLGRSDMLTLADFGVAWNVFLIVDSPWAVESGLAIGGGWLVNMWWNLSSASVVGGKGYTVGVVFMKMPLDSIRKWWRSSLSLHMVMWGIMVLE